MFKSSVLGFITLVIVLGISGIALSSPGQPDGALTYPHFYCKGDYRSKEKSWALPEHLPWVCSSVLTC
ncbi:MAG: hypothetical protein ACYTG7_25645 [Planctomycetota bacterium]|jgi:hypothetical protein